MPRYGFVGSRRQIEDKRKDKAQGLHLLEPQKEHPTGEVVIVT